MLLMLNLNYLIGQDKIPVAKKILLRDSLDFIDNKITINTASNEFSPIPYHGGLLYISNKPIQNQKFIFNKVYWVDDSILLSKNNSKISPVNTMEIKFKTNDDYTPQTSNDNNTLLDYRIIKKLPNLNEVETNFSEFTTDQAFSYNEKLKIVIYAQQTGKRVAGNRKWELWQTKIVNGKISHKKRIDFDDEIADYLYPFISDNSDTLFFASNRKGSLGGYDLFYVKRNGDIWDNKPIPLEFVNSSADEISPTLVHDTLLFSSNRPGGLGGFDVYSNLIHKTSAVLNLGYPMNTVSDELSLHKINNNYYLTTNRTGNFDILGVKHVPVYYELNGVLKYKNDSSLASHQLLYFRDVDAGVVVDSLFTDSLAKYHFVGKPNRNYLISTYNYEKKLECFAIETYPNQKTFAYFSNLYGRSPKQIQDSIQSLYILTENKLKDSIISNDLRQKYIVRYGFDKNVLSDKEKLVLDSLIIKLSKIPNTYVIIGAFTDCVGSYKYNYLLSVKRAKYVVNYLVNHGLSKDRIVSNGYSKKYTLTPCITRYAKSNQPNSRRAEILLSETKNTDWASLNTLKGDTFYTPINSTAFKLKNSATLKKTLSVVENPIKNNKQVFAKNTIGIVKKKQASIQLHNNNLAKTIPNGKTNAVAKEIHLKDSIRKLELVAALNAKKVQQLKNKLNRIKQDSIKGVIIAIAKQAQEQAIKLAQQLASEKSMALTNEIKLKDSIKKAGLLAANKQLQFKDSIKRATLLAAANELRLKDSINKAEVLAALNAKMEQQLKVKIERIKQDSIKGVMEAIAKQAQEQAIKLAEQRASEKANVQVIAIAKQHKLKDSIKKAEMFAAVNKLHLKDSINKAEMLAANNLIHLKDSIKNAELNIALNAKKEQSLKDKIERFKQDSIRVVKEAIVKQAQEQAIKLAQQKAIEKALAVAFELRLKDSINKAKVLNALNAKKEQALKDKIQRIKQDSIRKAAVLATLNVKNEKLLKDKLDRIKQDSITQAKAKEQMDLVARVTASKKMVKDSLLASKTKSILAKPNELVEEDLTKEEILKSLDILAKLKREQERIVEYLTKRINKKPIIIFVNSDTVAIEIYDNGIHDKDSVSVIYNNRIVVDRQELKVNIPIKFKLKVDKVAKNNELVFVAENLGTEPPNTGVMFITDKPGHRQQVVLSTDMTHNEVVYFIRIAKQ